MTPHEHLLAECQRIGWPEHYKTDLEHDQELLAHYEPPQFGWGLRKCGTDMFIPDDTPLVPHWTYCGATTPREWALKWAEAVGKVRNQDTRLYWWDGAALKRVALPTLLEKLRTVGIATQGMSLDIPERAR